MAGLKAPARGKDAACGAGPEDGLPSNYVAPDESDVLRDEVDQRIDDVLTGKIKTTRYSSVDEYFRYLETVFPEMSRWRPGGRRGRGRRARGARRAGGR